MMARNSRWPALVLVFNACGLFTTEPPGGEPYLRGTVTNVEQLVTASGPVPGGLNILVEEVPGLWEPPPRSTKKSYFWISDELTTVLVRGPSGWERGPVSDIAVGQVVSGWYGDVILESYPSKGEGTHIAIQ